MVTARKQGLIRQQGLNRTDIAEIEQLVWLCNKYEHLDIKLNWDILYARSYNEINDFLYYDNGLLTGYMGLFTFNGRDGEISAMVHPAYRCMGIFRQMEAAAREECQRRGIVNVMLIVEQVSRSGQALAKRWALAMHHAEYKMILGRLRTAMRINPYLQLREATLADSKTLAYITACAFAMPEHEVDWYTTGIMERMDRQYYLGVLNSVCIGKVDVIFDTHEAIICGFGVLPEYQGYGYGRQILVRTVQELQVAGWKPITLEVETQNKHALALYKSCGFKITSCYLYYQLTLGKK